jgi:hypothetical protein
MSIYQNRWFLLLETRNPIHFKECRITFSWYAEFRQNWSGIFYVINDHTNEQLSFYHIVIDQ